VNRFTEGNRRKLVAAWAKRRRNFMRPRADGTMAVMAAFKPVEVSNEQLAELAKHFFANVPKSQIPEKLWLDTAVNLEQTYLRACYRRSILKSSTLFRLAALADAIDQAYGTKLVVVAYNKDHAWQQLEVWNALLNRVD